MTFFKRSTFAVLSGLLMYCAFVFHGGVIFSIISLVIFIRLIEKSDSFVSRWASIVLFLLTFIFLQFSFIVAKSFAESKDVENIGEILQDIKECDFVIMPAYVDSRHLEIYI